MKVLTLRSICNAPNDPVALHHDAWGLKKLFTYGVRKSGHDKLTNGSPARRDSWLVERKDLSFKYTTKSCKYKPSTQNCHVYWNVFLPVSSHALLSHVSLQLEQPYSNLLCLGCDREPVL